jgi:regulator of nucleoside diphosphate kinase
MPDVLPDIVIPASECERLQRLVRDASADSHPVAHFLNSELRRAAIASPHAEDMAAIVSMGSWVKYRIDWGYPTEVKRLVYPEDYRSPQWEVSVLSPLGVALLGLRAGSRMLFRDILGTPHVVSVECVDRIAPILPMFPITRNVRLQDPDDDPHEPNPAA